MPQDYHTPQAYPADALSVTDADGQSDHLSVGTGFHLFVVCATAAGAYIGLLALVLSMKGA